MTIANRSILTAFATYAVFFSTVPAFVAGFLIRTSPAEAQDMSNGANNFYKSDKVTVRKVSFKNQYQMNVVGNLFTPKDLDRNAKPLRDHRRASDGCGEGAKRQSLCHQIG